MPRRWWIACLAVLLLLAVAGLKMCAEAIQPRWCINGATSEQIQEGMTEEQVRAILRLPPSDYTVFKDSDELQGFLLAYGSVRLDEADKAKTVEWVSDEGSITVVFLDGKVKQHYYLDTREAPTRKPLDILKRLSTRVR
jgi:hypothetical protein